MNKRAFTFYLASWSVIVATVFYVGHGLLHGSESMPTGLGVLFLPGVLVAALLAPDGVHSATPYLFAGVAISVNWVIYCYFPVWLYRRLRFRRERAATR